MCRLTKTLFVRLFNRLILRINRQTHQTVFARTHMLIWTCVVRVCAEIYLTHGSNRAGIELPYVSVSQIFEHSIFLSGHMTLMQRRLNVNALYKRYVSDVVFPWYSRPRWLSWIRLVIRRLRVRTPPVGNFLSWRFIMKYIFYMVILSLPLIQGGQLSVSDEKTCTILVNRIED